MGASDHLSNQQFASVHDLVYKYDKTDVQAQPMEGVLDSAHSRGRDWGDLVETKADHAPIHTAEMLTSVARQGVQKPIGIDSQARTVTDGHTRLMAAWATGQRRVRVREVPIGGAEDKHVDREHPWDEAAQAAWDRVPKSVRGI